MARPLRVQYPGAFYHVTARGNERRNIYKSQRDREKFLSYLQSASERYAAIIHAYCLLDNHYHLLMETPEGNLAQIMRHINGAYATYFNTKRKRVGHLLQGRYKAIVVDRDAYAQELSRYIHLNPLRAQMTKAVEEHPWSSYLDYCGRRIAPEWLCTDFILSYFGTNAHENYRLFVEQGDGENPLNSVVASTILGDESFVEKIISHLDGKENNRDLPAMRRLIVRPSLDKIISHVHAELADEPRLAKQLSLYLGHRFSGRSLKEIGEKFGISESGVSQVSRRLSVRMADDEGLRRKVDRVVDGISLSRV